MLGCTNRFYSIDFEKKKRKRLILGLFEFTLYQNLFSSDEAMISMMGLHPSFVSGFIDAEGSFGVSVRKKTQSRLGWSVEPSFARGLDLKDDNILKQIRCFFGVGTIYYKPSSVYYMVSSLEDISHLIGHFDKYSLISQKHADYLLFKQVILMLQRKEHLTSSGLQAIVNIRATINRGLTLSLKEGFPNTVAVTRPLVATTSQLDPNWIAGFTSGEGCFSVKLIGSTSHKLGQRVILSFTLTQHSRDKILMESLPAAFGCGKYYPRESREYGVFELAGFKDIENKIIPFFKKHKIQGEKSEDFKRFCRVAEIVKAKDHLTLKGLEEIKKLKSEMNKARRLG